MKLELELTPKMVMQLKAFKHNMQERTSYTIDDNEYNESIIEALEFGLLMHDAVHILAAINAGMTNTEHKAEQVLGVYQEATERLYGTPRKVLQELTTAYKVGVATGDIS